MDALHKIILEEYLRRELLAKNIATCSPIKQTGWHISWMIRNRAHPIRNQSAPRETKST